MAKVVVATVDGPERVTEHDDPCAVSERFETPEVCVVVPSQVTERTRVGAPVHVAVTERALPAEKKYVAEITDGPWSQPTSR